MTDLRLTVSMLLACVAVAVTYSALGWFWLVDLNPTLPLIPAACFLIAGFCCALAGKYWGQLDDYSQEEGN